MKTTNVLLPTEKELATNAYALNYIKTHIKPEWWGNGAGASSYYQSNRAKLLELRSHMAGTANTDRFKDQMGIDKDHSTVAIDWSPLATIPKIIKIVVDGESDDLYFVTANAIDDISQKEKSRRKHEIEAKMKMQDMLKEQSEKIGYDITFSDQLPETDEELFLQMELSEKLEQEVAIENAVRKIFKINKWNEISNRVKEDIATLRVGVISHALDPEIGIKIKYVDPIDYICSRDKDKARDGSGRDYHGEMLPLTIAEVRRLSGDTIPEEELLAAAKKFTKASSGVNLDRLNSDNINDTVVDVLRYCFRDVKKQVQKKKYNRHGGYKYVDKESDWEPIKGREGQKIESMYETWYGGYWILDTETIWDHKELEDLVRPKSNIRKALAPYSMYDINTPSLAEKILPMADAIQLAHLKMQLAAAKARSAGYMIDIDTLTNLQIGQGQTWTVPKLIKEFKEGDDLPYSGKTLDGATTPRLPVSLIPSTMGNEIVQYMNMIKHYQEEIERLTGINKFKDGSTPSGDALFGVQKLSILMSNNAVKHIFRGSESIALDTAYGVATRLQDLGIYGEIGDGLAQLIGQDTAKILQKQSDKHYWSFSIDLEMKPTAEEEEDYKTDLRLALERNAITPADKIELQSIDNIKLRSKFLAAKEKAKDRKEKMFQEKMVRIKAEEDRRTVVQTEKAKAISAQETLKAKRAVINFEAEAKGLLQSDEWLSKMKFMQAEYDRKKEIAIIESGAKHSMEKEKEQNKAVRSREEATMQARNNRIKEDKDDPVDYKKEKEFEESMENNYLEN